jgi:deoxyribose-phosphate aldolase
MEQFELMKHIDHTLLKAFATWGEIQVLCDEAIEYKTASVCIPPAYIERIRKKYQDKINICTVIGFPLGYSCLESKLAECEQAIKDGADEIDMVINISHVKNKDYDKVKHEIEEIKKTAGKKIVKVII